MKIQTALASLAVTASALTAGTMAVTTPAHAASITQVSTHAPRQLPAWLRWAPAPGTARAHCHGGPAVIVWVAGHHRRGVTACEQNEIIWPGGQARTRSAHNPPAWLHWTRASANPDCRRGPAVILWINESDQSAEACQVTGTVLPS